MNGTGTPQHLYSPNKKTHEPHPRVPTALPHLRNTSASFILRHTQTTTNTKPPPHNKTKSPQDPPIRRHLQGKSKTCQKHCTNMSHLRGGGQGPQRPLGSRPRHTSLRFTITTSPSTPLMQQTTRKQTHNHTHTHQPTNTTPHRRPNIGTGSNLKRETPTPRQPHRSA